MDLINGHQPCFMIPLIYVVSSDVCLCLIFISYSHGVLFFIIVLHFVNISLWFIFGMSSLRMGIM